MLDVNIFSRLLSQRGKQTAVIDLFPSDQEAVFLLRQSGSQLPRGKAELPPFPVTITAEWSHPYRAAADCLNPIVGS